MAPQRKPAKRRIPGTPVQHQGRVTSPGRPDAGLGGTGPNPAASSRYTPRRPTFRIRPTGHTVAGWCLVAVGVAISVLNDFAYFGSTPLPGGHSELYLILGVAVAAYGTWWLGLFDRPS
jgi:hypothetical protein